VIEEVHPESKFSAKMRKITLSVHFGFQCRMFLGFQHFILSYAVEELVRVTCRT
jgi:hypothetical protein